MEEIFKKGGKTVYFDYEEHMAKVIYETGKAYTVYIYLSPTVEDMENLYND
jgi:hypothetical protein